MQFSMFPDAPILLPVPAQPAAMPVLFNFEDDLAAAAEYAERSHAVSTIACYEADWRQFAKWAQARGMTPLPADPETVAAFLAHEAQRGCRPSTIGRRAASIRWVHRRAGYDQVPTSSEKVRATVAGIRRTLGVAPKKKAPATAEIVKDMIRTAPAGKMKTLRDTAVLALGFGGAFRRSELAAIRLTDITYEDDGIFVFLAFSKTDQQGAGRRVPIIRGSGNTCPVKAIKAWIEAAQLAGDDYLFPRLRRGGQVVRGTRIGNRVVADIVKAGAARLDLPVADFAGHSLRRGFCSSAARKGSTVAKITAVTGHRSAQCVMGYIDDVQAFECHAGAGLL